MAVPLNSEAMRSPVGSHAERRSLTDERSRFDCPAHVGFVCDFPRGYSHGLYAGSGGDMP